MSKRSIYFVLVCLSITISCQAAGSFWDSERYIDLEELKPGMKGYGLTIFKGTQIEKFDVELVSVVKRFDPGRDAFLVMCQDPRFDLARGTQGVSGSPVYFEGRLAGAMSFGWAFGEEPLYGVTPIREMLDVKETGDLPRKHQVASASPVVGKPFYVNLMRSTLADRETLARIVQDSGLGRPSQMAGSFNLPLAVSVGGVNENTIRKLSEWLPGINLQGITGGLVHGDGSSKLEPGSALVIPLSIGDINTTLLGTVTEVRGDSVWGFGHSWNGNGQVWYPMGTGTIHTFVNSKNMSFKLGSLLEVKGVLRADEAAAVYGTLDQKIELADIDLKTLWKYNQRSREFHAQVVRDPQLTPILAGLGAIAATEYSGALPDEVTLKYRIEMDFGTSGKLDFENVSSGRSSNDLFEDTMMIVMTILNNPWQRVELKRMSLDMAIDDKDSVGYMLAADLNKLVFKPGEEAHAVVELEPDYGSSKRVACSLALPSNIKPGKYQIRVGGREACMQMIAQAWPWLNNPLNAKAIMKTLQVRQNLRRDRLYMMLALNDNSIAPEGEPLPGLPESKIALLEDDRRQIESYPHRSLLRSDVGAEWVVMGDATFEIEVVEKTD